MAIDLQHARDLKRRLVAFARSPRLSTALNRWRRDGRRDDPEESLIDSFVHEWTDNEGRDLVDRFLLAVPDLDETDRRILAGWQDWRIGVFRIEAVRDDGYDAFNLVDELHYRLTESIDTPDPSPLDVGVHVASRIVPHGVVWAPTGRRILFADNSADRAWGAAAELAQRFPRLPFTNPDKLREAREFQADLRETFIRLFGSDELVVRGSEVQGILDRFYQAVREAARAKLAARGMDPGSAPDLPRAPLPASFDTLEDVGCIMQPGDDLRLSAGFGMFREAFQDPDKGVTSPWKEVVAEFLESPAVAPHLVERVATSDLARTDRLLSAVLGWPDFSWQAHGERLLRECKAAWYAEPQLPHLVVLSDLQAAGLKKVRAMYRKSEEPA